VPRTAKPQISFADWELLQQGISLEPLLQSICDFLDDHEEMIEAVRHDLERGLRSPGTGRSGLTPPQVLRSRTGRIVNCANGSPTDTLCASLRIFTANRCQSMMRSTAPLTD
jgi:hypothetical protein